MVNKRLSREEQETIITFDRTPHKAVIFTYEPTWQKHLEQRLGLKPIADNGFGAREYLLDKNFIRLPPKKQGLSTEQREDRAARLRANKAKGKSKPKAQTTVLI